METDQDILGPSPSCKCHPEESETHLVLLSGKKALTMELLDTQLRCNTEIKCLDFIVRQSTLDCPYLRCSCKNCPVTCCIYGLQNILSKK